MSPTRTQHSKKQAQTLGARRLLLAPTVQAPWIWLGALRSAKVLLFLQRDAEATIATEHTVRVPDPAAPLAVRKPDYQGWRKEGEIYPVPARPRRDGPECMGCGLGLRKDGRKDPGTDPSDVAVHSPCDHPQSKSASSHSKTGSSESLRT